MTEHLAQVRATSHEYKAGELIICFNTGEKLHKSEAQKLNQSIAEQLTQGELGQEAEEFVSSIPHRCPQLAPGPQRCYLEEGHGGEHEFEAPSA